MKCLPLTTARTRALSSVKQMAYEERVIADISDLALGVSAYGTHRSQGRLPRGMPRIPPPCPNCQRPMRLSHAFQTEPGGPRIHHYNCQHCGVGITEAGEDDETAVEAGDQPAAGWCQNRWTSGKPMS